MGFMSFLTLSDDGNEVRSTIEQIELGGQLYVTRLVRVNSFRSKLSSLLADEEGPSLNGALRVFRYLCRTKPFFV